MRQMPPGGYVLKFDQAEHFTGPFLNLGIGAVAMVLILLLAGGCFTYCAVKLLGR